MKYKLLPGGYVDETGPHRGVPPTPQEIAFQELMAIARKSSGAQMDPGADDAKAQVEETQ